EGLFSLYGLPPAPGIALERWKELVHPEDRERLWTTLEATLLDSDGQDAYREEFRIVRPDGEVRWMSSRGQVLRDAAGRAVRCVGINVDITERRRGEEELRRSQEALRDSEQRLRLATESADIGTWDLHPENGRLIWSDTTKRLFGLSSQAPV